MRISMRRWAWFSRSWHSRESFTPCSNNSRLRSRGNSPCSSSRTISSSCSREDSKDLGLSFVIRAQTLVLWRQKGLPGQLVQLLTNLILEMRRIRRQIFHHRIGHQLCQLVILYRNDVPAIFLGLLHCKLNHFSFDIHGRKRAVAFLLNVHVPGDTERDYKQRLSVGRLRQFPNFVDQLFVHSLFQPCRNRRARDVSL